MCLTPERRKAWLGRLGKPETTPAAELSDDAIMDQLAADHDAQTSDIKALTPQAAKATALSADVQRLTTELEAERGKVLALSGSAPRTPDPEALRDRADNYVQRIDLMVDRGDMDKATADKIKAVVVPTGGPSVLMLSADPGLANRRPVDFVLSLFDGSKSGVKTNNAVPRTAAGPPPRYGTLALDSAGGTGESEADTREAARKEGEAWQAKQQQARGLVAVK